MERDSRFRSIPPETISLEAPQPTGIGVRLPRKEDARYLNGRGSYVGDIKLPGLKDVALLQGVGLSAARPGSSARVACRVRQLLTCYSPSSFSKWPCVRVSAGAPWCAVIGRFLFSNSAAFLFGQWAFRISK